MKTCSKCKKDYADDVKFCLMDGTALDQDSGLEKQCPACKRTYPAEGAFCMADGTALVAVGGTTTARATKPRKKRAPRRNSPKKRTTPQSQTDRAIFLRGMTRWFQQMGYGVGLAPGKVDTEKDQKFAESALEAASELFSVAGGMWIGTAGAGTEELFRALIPYVPLCDLLGSKVVLGTVSLVPLMFGDELAVAEIESRYAQLLDLAGPLTQFGPQLNFQSFGQAQLLPLIVFFDPARFAAAEPQLMACGWQRRGTHITLQASLVNVREEKVLFAERTGIYAMGEKMAELFGHKLQPFEGTDIQGVLLLGKPEAATA